MTTLDQILARFLSRFPQLKLAILFGSQASGDANGNSDIDLALLSNAPLSRNLKMELIEQIGTKFGRPVDIVDLFYAAEPVLGEDFKGKRLLGNDTTYAELLTRRLINTADFVPLQQRIRTERREAWIR